MDKNVWIVIAAYNEEHSLPKVVSELKQAGYHNIVAVDDGSRDSTFEAGAKAGATMLQHVINRGQGASLKTGIDYALRQGADIIVTFDADGQHRVEDLLPVIRPVADERADITFGSRFLKRTNVPLMRKILLKGSIVVLWLFYGVRMTDAHNGFRALSRYAAQKIDLRADRMDHASEFIEEVHRKQLKYREVPVVIKYTRRTLKRGHGSFAQAFKILSNMIMKKFFMR
jgi:glycosyltransferase involved in cell wall biosynthesis